MDSRELVGNLLGCPKLSTDMHISMADVATYCNRLKQVLPGYVFFENSPDEIVVGVQQWNDFAKWDPSQKCFSLTGEKKPNLQKVNAIFPDYISKTIETFTCFFLITQSEQKNFSDFAKQKLNIAETSALASLA
ncbi:MAG: hypothetical protein ACLRS7_13645 [Acutalibacter sp.]